MGVNLKKISHGERASIYIVNPHNDIHPDDLKQFNAWLEQYCPEEYDLDGYYLTITPQAEVILALTFELV